MRKIKEYFDQVYESFDSLYEEAGKALPNFIQAVLDGLFIFLLYVTYPLWGILYYFNFKRDSEEETNEKNN